MTRIVRLGRPPSAGCPWVRERLAALALEMLPRREAARAAFHLARCSSCRAEASRERDLVSLLPQALEPCIPPPEVLDRVLQRVQARRRSWRSRWAAAGAGIAAMLVVGVGVLAPEPAIPLEGALQSPDVVVLNLFVSLDSPLSSHYEFRTVSSLSFDRSVGRILYNVRTGDWKLVVHGLPRPPRGAHYALAAQLEGRQVPLGVVGRWEHGVATLAGRSAFDLTETERLSVELVGQASRVRLLEFTEGSW